MYSPAWSQYLDWQLEDKRMLKRINQLIKDIMRDPFQGIGKPEPLKNEFSGWWSRRIDETNRVVYRQQGDRLHYISRRYVVGDIKINAKIKKRSYIIFGNPTRSEIHIAAMSVAFIGFDEHTQRMNIIDMCLIGCP